MDLDSNLKAINVLQKNKQETLLNTLRIFHKMKFHKKFNSAF